MTLIGKVWNEDCQSEGKIINYNHSFFNMTQKEQDQIKSLKIKLMEYGLEDFLDQIMFTPQIPMSGTIREFVIEEFYGLKIARLISAPND